MKRELRFHVKKGEICTMKNTGLSILFFLFLIQFSYAQSDIQNLKSPVLAGKILDAGTKKPIEFAAVALLNPADSSVSTGAITDAEGKFLMNDLTAGSYILRVTFVGYGDDERNISINTNPAFNNAGVIELKAGTSLDDVVIEADQSYFQNSIDKKVYNIDKDIVAASGNASDALQTIPSVTIDIDGNISLRGNTGITIWIDGKPTGISGSSMNAILEQIPASNIESIEVVTNPSARYDAAGTAGIINIVMKKNKQAGLNGNVSAGIATTPRYEGSAALNYRNHKINLYSNYSYMHDDRSGYGESYRKTFEADTISYLNSNNESENIAAMHMGRAGLDYYLNDKNTIGVNGSFHTGIMDNLNTVYYDFLNNDSVSTSTSQRVTDGRGSNSSYDVGMSYKKIFSDPKHMLTANADYSYGKNSDSSNYSEQFFDPLNNLTGADLQNIERPGINKNIEAQMDYVHPFKNGNQFETGVKYSKEVKDNAIYSESFDTLSDTYINDINISNQFIYNEDVYAAYVIWNSSIKKFGYQVGLRAEQTNTNSELVTTDENFTNNYFGLFPSAHLAYKFSEKMEMSLSYSRRIDRPNSWFLNPFPDYSDPYNLRFGNPFLEPEYENSYEMGFTRFWEKHSIDASVFYTQTLNEISPYITIDSNGISNMTFENYNNESQYGTEFIVRSEFFKWWNATGSFNFNQTILDAKNLEENLTNSVFNYNIRVMSFFQLAKSTSFQVTFSYSTPWTYAQGKSDPVFSTDAGLKTSFMKNKLDVNLSMSDIFNTRQWGGYSEGLDYYSEYFRKRESRIFTVKLTYKFGQQDNRRKSGSQENYDNGGNFDMF